MELDTFVFSAALLLTVASIAVVLSRHLGLGSILGLLVAGIAVGPHSPGLTITHEVEDMRHFTELGVVMLLFLIGLEMRPQRLWAMRREVFGLGSLQILLSGAAIALYISFYQPNWQTALLLGLTLALSSTAFVMQLLQERGELNSRHGNSAFAVLLMQDLAIVPLLALIPILSDVGTLSGEVPLWQQLLTIGAILGGLFAFGHWLVPQVLERLMRQNNRDAIFLVVMLTVFLAASATHFAGLSMALGAFVMGMLLSGSRYNYQIQAHVEPYKGLLMSLFFVAVGMSIDPGVLADDPLRFLQHLIAIIAIKLLILWLLARGFGLDQSVAIRISFLLAQSGEFGFVLFGAARALGVIDDATFVLAVAVVSSSMLLTPLLVHLGDRLASRRSGEHGEQQPPAHPLSAETGHAPPQVIIAGYGRVGHTVATLLEASAVTYLAVDTNPAHIALGEADQRPVYYGDIGDPDLLHAIDLDQAKAVVLTIDHPPTVLRAVKLIRSSNRDITIIARARDLAACAVLTEAGATTAHPEALEASLRLGSEVLAALDLGNRKVSTVMDEARDQNYALVRDTMR